VNRILAVASGGGHWKELMLIKKAFLNADVHYVSTSKEKSNDDFNIKHSVVNDCSYQDKLKMVYVFFQILIIIYRFKPDTIISTGACPGFLSVLIGKVFGVQTIWVDSIANADKMSLSGRVASRFVDVCITQWEHLANERVLFKGAVL
jgi:UDP-N-acetylglucosamine:LPS N-acetylglucosamine transferase